MCSTHIAPSTIERLLSKATAAVEKRTLDVRRIRYRYVCGEVHCKQFERVEEDLTKTLSKLFQDQIRSVRKELRQLKSQSAESLAELVFRPSDWDEELVNRALPVLAHAMSEAILSQIMLLEGAKSTASEWLDSQGLDVPPGMLTDVPDWAVPLLKEFLAESFEQPYWKRINETTRDDIERFLDDGLREGWSVNRMASEISSAFPDEYSMARGRLVARTESGHALNGARSMATNQLKEELGEAGQFIKREWVSVLGNTTRDAHAALDGTFEDEEGMFTLAGSRCRWPGDITLPVSQRANCQCTVISNFDAPTEEEPIEEIAKPEPEPSGFPPHNPRGKDTEQRFKKPDGSWTEERQQLHDRIVEEWLKDGVPQKNPTAMMTGGGPASGKSVALQRIKTPPHMIVIDSDEIKKKLPEYMKGLKDKNPEAAAFVHEESSYLSKRITSEASKRKYNLLLDGTGNGSIKSMEKKVKRMREGGHRVVAHYVTVDTDTAVQRNEVRAARTGRLVPEAFIRGSHQKVSEIVPQALQQGLYDEFALWDTSSSETVKVASAKGKKLKVHDDNAWEAFKAKAELSVIGGDV